MGSMARLRRSERRTEEAAARSRATTLAKRFITDSRCAARESALFRNAQPQPPNRGRGNIPSNGGVSSKNSGHFKCDDLASFEVTQRGKKQGGEMRRCERASRPAVAESRRDVAAASRDAAAASADAAEPPFAVAECAADCAAAGADCAEPAGDFVASVGDCVESRGGCLSYPRPFCDACPGEAGGGVLPGPFDSANIPLQPSFDTSNYFFQLKETETNIRFMLQHERPE